MQKLSATGTNLTIFSQQMCCENKMKVMKQNYFGTHNSK